MLNYGYKVQADGKCFFFTGDYEQPINIYQPSERKYAAYQYLVDKQKQMLIDFIEGCDVVLADAQYTQQEYSAKVGWGHGTYEAAIELAAAADIKQLYFTHHEPTRTDRELDDIYQRLMARGDLPATKFYMAAEGTQIKL